jgi:hypothetical protein
MGDGHASTPVVRRHSPLGDESGDLIAAEPLERFEDQRLVAERG